MTVRLGQACILQVPLLYGDLLKITAFHCCRCYRKSNASAQHDTHVVKLHEWMEIKRMMTSFAKPAQYV